MKGKLRRKQLRQLNLPNKVEYHAKENLWKKECIGGWNLWVERNYIFFTSE